MASSTTQLDALPMEAPKSTARDETSRNSANVRSTISQQQLKQQQTFLRLEQLPDLVLDKILDLLEPQDLRSYHQVSKAWQSTLLRRPRIDSRRVELVNKIRLNKENIARGCSLDSATPSSKNNGGVKSYAHDGKPGSRSILRTVSNSRPNSSITSTKKPPARSISTPTSRFLLEYEAGTKLLQGQTLFRCPKCTGPVPSPISTAASIRQLQGGFRQILDSCSKVQQKSSSLASAVAASPSTSNITQDSGFESIEVPQDQLSMISIEEDGSTEELLSMSFIPSPPSPMDRKSSTEIGLLLRQRDDHDGDSAAEQSLDSDISFSSFNTSRSSTSCGSRSSINEQQQHGENESTECPKCSHRFCCHCQCTEHPGRPCKEINGDSLSFTDSCNNLTNNENTNSKSDKAIKRSKKALRRLARV